MLNLKLSLVVCVAAFSLAACSAADDVATEPTEDTTADLTARQCKGFLPQNCQVCADGTTACAHWVVKNKKCTIQTCAPAPTTCVQNVLCAIGNHWSTARCECVSNTCVDNVLCVIGRHWDQTQCACVPN